MNDIPHAIMRTWEEAAIAEQRAATIEGSQPGLEAELAKAETWLRELRTAHATRGRDIIGYRLDAEQYREMVECWCDMHGVALPPPVTNVQLAETTAFPAQQVAPENAYPSAPAVPAAPLEPLPYFKDAPASEDKGEQPADNRQEVTPLRGGFHPGGGDLD